jgi:hypothetical protein
MSKRKPAEEAEDTQIDLLELIKSQDGSKYANAYTGFTLGGQSVGQVENRLLPEFLKIESKSGKLVFCLTGSIGEPQCKVTMHESLRTLEERTAAFDDVAQFLVEKGIIKKKKNEPYSVSAGWGKVTLCLIDRNAAPFFGITSVGVHLNCLVRKPSEGGVHLWVQRRAPTKDHFPNCIDPTVAGGQPYGLSLHENMCKEANEEAGIENEQAAAAVSVGVITKMSANSDGSGLKQRFVAATITKFTASHGVRSVLQLAFSAQSCPRDLSHATRVIIMSHTILPVLAVPVPHSFGLLNCISARHCLCLPASPHILCLHRHSSMYFLYDLEVTDDWQPNCLDGEVSGFQLMSIAQVKDSICNPHSLVAYRPTIRLHMIDFLIRHGALMPDTTDNYAEVCAALHQPRLCL